MRAVRGIGALILGVLLLWTGAARADAVEDFYKGRTITVYVASGPGGGYDAYGRLVAQYLPALLPGHPQTVVENMPGAGGRTVANFLYNKAPKDGTAIGILQAPIIMDPLLYGKDAQGVLYDPQKFAWLGSFDQFTPIAVVWNTLGIKTIDQAKGKEIKFGVADSETKPNVAVQAQTQFIQRNKAIMITGSVSSATAIALEELAQREKVLNMVGLSGSNDVYFQLPGSLVNGALINGGPDALISHSIGSAVPGRYIFQVRNGTVSTSPSGPGPLMISGNTSLGTIPLGSAISGSLSISGGKAGPCCPARRRRRLRPGR